MVVPRRSVLPFYLVLDMSSSMREEGEKAVNEALPRLVSDISGNLVLADKTRFGVLTFASTAEILLPLTSLADLEQLPVARAGGLTSYAAAFELLRHTIDADVAALKAEGLAVFRPSVFFVTDGMPNGPDWRAPYRVLVGADNPNRPIIMSFGVGEARRDGTGAHQAVSDEILGAVATDRAFYATDSPGEAIARFAQAMTRSIVMTGTARGDRFRVPVEPGPGFVEKALIDLDEL